ncbi:hypothetical protein Pmar_PMAR029472, partial [Perkinsus marinus ATCC 50983]
QGCSDEDESDEDGSSSGVEQPKKAPLKLLRSVSSRWLSQGLAISRVVRIYVPIVKALSSLEDEGDFACGGFKNFMLKIVNITCMELRRWT